MITCFAARKSARIGLFRTHYRFSTLTCDLSSLSTTFVMASSPPTTPPAELPYDPALRRFEDTGATCEWAEEYRPGGFHPVNLGDTFHYGKYRVIRKIGDGSYSTVWLAVSSEYVHQYSDYHFRTSQLRL
jgi:hypothetical protein